MGKGGRVVQRCRMGGCPWDNRQIERGMYHFNDFGEEDVDTFFDEHEDEIRDEVYSRNDSDVIKDLIRHTDNIPIRVEMLSDHDCINSNWFESQGGYSYEKFYFGEMVDCLNLNPARVKRLLTEHGYKTYGRSRTAEAGTARNRFHTSSSTRS